MLRLGGLPSVICGTHLGIEAPILGANVHFPAIALTRLRQTVADQNGPELPAEAAGHQFLTVKAIDPRI
jgi:hypothetical protein